jgi:hypothetical protein
MKRVLIVSPHFPPVNAPDMQRIRMSLPYYRAGGWEPVVLAVGDAWQETVREPELLATIPPDMRVVRCGAIPHRWSRFVGLGSLGPRAWLHLFFAGWRLLRRERFDLVFFSNTQFVTFALGRLWRRLCGVPYVLDVQDPWRTDHYERAGSRPPPGGWKYQFARLQARLLEGWSFRRASAVMSVSPRYLADLGARYPFFTAKPAAVIPFGASADDLTHALALPPPADPFPRDRGQIHFVYTGASGPILPHAVTVLFTAVRQYRDRAPDRAGRLRFHFLGTSYVAPGQGRNTVQPLAEQHGVADLVAEIPHRLGHLECLRLQHAADVLLLPGSSDPAYSPSKLYTYYLARRPILGLVFQTSVMETLLDELACAHVVRFAAAGPTDDARAALGRFFDAAVAGRTADLLPPRDEARFNAHYLAATLTRLQCELFDHALAPSAA